MDSAQKTLIDIASVSQRVVSALTRCTGSKTVESFRLDKIVVGSRSILEVLNEKLLLEDGAVDVRLVDWLRSREPQACLDTLNQMEEILNKKVKYSAKNPFKALQSGAQDKSDEAIRLFKTHQGYFHFLLTTDIWNCERNVCQRSQTLVEHKTQRTEEAPDVQDLSKPMRHKSEYSSSAPRENLINQSVCAEKLKTILGRLDAWNCKDIHSRTSDLRQPKTCTWLPKMNEFKTWRKTKDSFLWLRGKAGAGKSVLAASVIEYLKGTLQDSETLFFFYCDFRNERSTNTIEVMRSLLSQLLQQFHHHSVDSQGLIDDLEKEGTLIVKNIVRYISRAARHFSQQPLCVIDALDECKDLEDLLRALKQLNGGGIRLFVTSRPLQVIREHLSGLPSISMEMMNSEDISLHVDRELDSHRRLRIFKTSLKTEISSALCRKADGMFRWVHCQLNTLKRCTTAVQVRKTLDDLPSDLDATYSRILLRIDENPDEREVAQRALCWLVAAFEPLELSQILEGLSIDLERRVLDRDSAPVHGNVLLDALGSLVTYDELTDIVILSHASVMEYLVAESTRSKHPSYHIDTCVAHTKLALLCMCYIPAYIKQHQQSNGHAVHTQSAYRKTHTHSFNTPIRHRKFPVPSPSELYPLLSYAQPHGFRHLAYVDPADRKVFHAIEAFESDVCLHPIEWEQLRKRSKSFNWPSLQHDLVLYILVTFAPAQLLDLYIRHTQLKQKDGTNPLTYAALHYDIEHATILLSKGACVARKGWDLYGHRQILPLEAAASSFSDMVHLFLTEGSPVPCELFEGIVKGDHGFSTHGTLMLLQTDEFVEWAATVVDKESLLRVLHPMFSSGCSFEEDVEAIERRLIQIGCDTSDWFDKTNLRHAVCAGHVSIVKRMLSNGNVPLPSDIVFHATSWEMISFLLELGNDIHVSSNSGDTLLHLVIRTYGKERLETVRALIGAGCNPSACNLAGETPLHVAVRAGEHSIVKYLVSLDVPLPSDILLAASSFQMISSLLNAGVDVHVIAANGDTVLHATLGNHCYGGCDQCLKVTKLLINAGCNPCSPNVFGETPLHVAAKRDHLPVVQYLLSRLDIPLPPDILLSLFGDGLQVPSMAMIKLLLDKGADVHAMSPDGDNLLWIVANSHAGEEKRLRAIKILISAGCDAHACNKAGISLIHVAARRRAYTTIMEYLVSIGVPVPSDLNVDKHRWVMDYSQRTRDLLDRGDLCAIAENGDTLLHLAVRAEMEKDALDLAKLVVQRSGCSPNAFNSEQETPFHIASLQGYISVISYFLSLGASLPSNILLAASTGGPDRKKVILYLVQQGADAASTDAGATPLHWLFDSLRGHEHDCLQSAKILIEAGCDPHSRDLGGKTPMHLAAQCGYVSVIRYLLSRGIPPPHDILVNSEAKAFRFFLGNGVDLQSFIPILPLHHVLRFSHDEADCLELVRILINAGCDPSAENWLGETPIHIAARKNYISIIKYLLSQDATLPSNVLLAAVPKEGFWFNEDIIPLSRFLIHEGADANASTDDGDTPLHLVLCHAVHLEGRLHDKLTILCKRVEVLLNGGANPSARNADGKSAFDLAEEKGQLFKDNFLRLVRNRTVHRMRTTPTETRDDLLGALNGPLDDNRSR